MLLHEDQLEEKDMEISSLKSQITLLQLTLRCSPDVQLSIELMGSAPRDRLSPARFQSSDASSRDSSNPGEQYIQTQKPPPPTDIFTRKNVGITWEDWLTLFKSVAHWNAWTEEEKLLQMAGYFRKKALQEWILLNNTDKSSFAFMIRKMHS